MGCTDNRQPVLQLLREVRDQRELGLQDILRGGGRIWRVSDTQVWSTGTQLHTCVTAVDAGGGMALGASRSTVLPRHLLAAAALAPVRVGAPAAKAAFPSSSVYPPKHTAQRNATETL